MNSTKQRPRDICIERRLSDFSPYERYLQRADAYAAASSSSAVNCTERSELVILSSCRSNQTRSAGSNLVGPACRVEEIHVHESSSRSLHGHQCNRLQASTEIKAQNRLQMRKAYTNNELQVRATVRVSEREYIGVSRDRGESPVKARTRYFSTYASGQATALSEVDEIHQPVHSLADILLLQTYQDVPKKPYGSILPGLQSPIGSREPPLVRRTVQKRPRDCAVPLCQNYLVRFRPPRAKNQSLIKRSPSCSI